MMPKKDNNDFWTIDDEDMLIYIQDSSQVNRLSAFEQDFLGNLDTFSIGQKISENQRRIFNEIIEKCR